jgi:uncharacterized protein (DUF58 family)
MIQARLRQWWHDRLPRTDTQVLGQRNIYILPTPSGWSFTAVLLVNLIASINYQLNLGYMLIFLMAGVALVSMLVTHQTLRGVQLHLRPPASGFAREPLPVDVVVTAPTRDRHGLSIEFDGEGRAGRYNAVAHTHVAAGAQQMVTLSFVPPHRGPHEVPTIRVETRFPFGLFRAWSVWRPASKVHAWPTPERPVVPWPHAPAAIADGQARDPRQGDEWDGVRAWQRGDPLKRIVWKKVAHSGELVSRDTSGTVARELWFDWQHTQGLDNEARLSRLSAWVHAANQQGIAHGLRLPGLSIAPNVGAQHRVRALDALAKAH